MYCLKAPIIFIKLTQLHVDFAQGSVTKRIVENKEEIKKETITWVPILIERKKNNSQLI